MSNIDWRKVWFYLTIIFRPTYWIQNESYSRAWDKKLNQLMKKHNFQSVRGYTAFLGETQIWISNHPYCSFYPYNSLKVLPSRYTRYKARQKLEKDIINQ